MTTEKEWPGRSRATQHPTHDYSESKSAANRTMTPYVARFEHLAQRAAADPKFYEIAGCNVQHRADEIRAGVSG